MVIEPLHWTWPQFALLVLFGGHLLLGAMEHGQVRIQDRGAERGQPVRVNGFTHLIRVALVLFLLAAGGFFA